MKKLEFRSAAGIIALAATLTACGAVRIVPPDDDQPMLSSPANGGFEKTAPGGGADRWWRLGSPKPAYRMSLDMEVKRSGRNSARVESTSKDALWGAWNQSYNVLPFAGKKIRVVGWIKTEGAETCAKCETAGTTIESLPESERHGAEIRINQTPGSYTAVTPFVVGTSDWTRFEAMAQIATRESFIVAPILWGEGKAWFDDIEISVE